MLKDNEYTNEAAINLLWAFVMALVMAGAIRNVVTSNPGYDVLGLFYILSAPFFMFRHCIRAIRLVAQAIREDACMVQTPEKTGV